MRRRGPSSEAAIILTTMAVAGCSSGTSSQKPFGEFTACVRKAGFAIERVGRPTWGGRVVELRTSDRNDVVVFFAESKAQTDLAFRKVRANARDLATPGLHTDVVKTGLRVVQWSGIPSRKEGDALSGCL
jgi:hypothetical protein